MLSRQVYISGQLVPEEDAKISIFDTAVTLGDTVTESTRTFAHRPFKLDRHIERLYMSLKVTRIDPGCSPEELKRITLDLLEANLALIGPDEEYWIVHNISRGRFVPGPDPTVQSGAATVMINNSPLDLRGWASFYSAGCHAVTAMSRMIPSQSLDARVKNRSRMAYTLAEIEVKLVDPAAQGIILDIHGNVGENKGGNVLCREQWGAAHPDSAKLPGRDQSGDGSGAGRAARHSSSRNGVAAVRPIYGRRALLHEHTVLHYASHPVQTACQWATAKWERWLGCC